VVENNLLIYHELISNTGSYARLTIVPKEFYNVLFVAFHTNPAGGHLNSYNTLNHLCLRYYWPDMYSYIKRMCSACPGCALANLTRGKSSKLVYNFPVEAPFKVLHVDAYSAGLHFGFEGSTSYLIGCCSMCSFGILEPVTSANASTFASAITKMQLALVFATQWFWIKTVNSLVSAGNPLIFLKSTVTFCWAIITTLCLSNGCVGTSIKGYDYDKRTQFGVRGIGVIVTAPLCLEFMPRSGYIHFLQSCGCWPQICFSYQLFHWYASRIDVLTYYHQVLFPRPLQVPCCLPQDCNAIGI
jgi:hypothetical protein